MKRWGVCRALPICHLCVYACLSVYPSIYYLSYASIHSSILSLSLYLCFSLFSEMLQKNGDLLPFWRLLPEMPAASRHFSWVNSDLTFPNRLPSASKRIGKHPGCLPARAGDPGMREGMLPPWQVFLWSKHFHSNLVFIHLFIHAFKVCMYRMATITQAPY